MKANVPIHATVICRDGEAGTSKDVIVDPMNRRLTHIVVREHGLLDSERMVPFDLVGRTSEDATWIGCTRDELHSLDNFIEAHYVDLPYATAPVMSASYESQLSPLVISKRIPEGEVGLGRWAVVEATDGSVGHVKSLIVDTDGAQITHVVALTHHFLSRREVAVPVDEVERFFSDYVLLRVSRQVIDRLPHVAVHKASLLPALVSADQDLVPEDPKDAGVDESEPDASLLEGAHLLAGEVGPRLRARGFTDRQILDWTHAFLRSQHSEGDFEFLAWMREKEHASKSQGGPSGNPAAEERRAPILERPARRS